MVDKNVHLNTIAKHIKILNGEMGVVQKEMTAIKTDLKWIKKFIGHLTALIAGVFVSISAMAIKTIFLK